MPIEFRHTGGILDINYESALRGRYNNPPPISTFAAFGARLNASVVVDGYWDPDLQIGTSHSQNLAALISSARRHGYTGLMIKLNDEAHRTFEPQVEALSSQHNAEFAIIEPKRALHPFRLRIVFSPVP